MRRSQLRFILLLISLQTFVVATALIAQQFGGNPTSQKWRQLKTDSLRVIFPRGLDSTAFRVAGIIQRLQKSNNYRLGDKLENAPIVLQNLTTNSNGYVGLGPYRSEFYLSAPMDVFDLGSIDWASTLALHEYRHIIQYNNINRGVIRKIDFLLGDNARSLLSDMAVPDWFFEGDAVFNETYHSSQGRGRLPRFMNGFSILNRDGKHYNYQQLRNGSYRDYIPGHYELGYLLVSYGYRHYGTTFWGKVIQDAANYKGLFYPFQRAIRKNAGINFKTFRENAFNEYLQYYQSLQWLDCTTDQPDSSQASPVNNLTRLTPINNKEVISYMFPYPAGEIGPIELKDRASQADMEGVIALKNPGRTTSRFVYLHHGIEKNLGEAPISRDGYFGYNAGHIIYTRYRTDSRWNYKQYSDLEVLDIHSGKRRKLTRKGRYFTPDIITGGHLIAAAELQTDGKSAIKVLDSSGKVLLICKAPQGDIYNYPKFFQIGSSAALLFLIRQPDGKMGINYFKLPEALLGSAKNKIVSMEADRIYPLIPKKPQLLAYPVVRGHLLYYARVEPGLTDPYTILMELDLNNLVEGRRTLSNPIGAAVRDVYQGFGGENGHTAVASLQTADGYGLFQWKLSQTQRQKLDQMLPGRLVQLQKPIDSSAAYIIENAHTHSYFLPVQAGNIAGESRVSRKSSLLIHGNQPLKTLKKGAVKKYPLLSHPFNFHSLQPTVDDPVYGLDLLGQNILNTVQTRLSYNYNRVTQISSAGGDLTLGLWYLQPYLHMDYSWDHLAADSKGHQFYYKELTSQLGLQLPLNFTGGRWQRSLYLSTALSQSNLHWESPKPEPGAALEKIRYLYSRLQFSMYARQASLQLYPRLGFNNYTEMNTPLDGKGARQWMNSTTIYLPGLLPTHSLRWNLAYQHKDTVGTYGYNSRFPFSRGYVRPGYANMWKFGLDYSLPVCYPDFGFADMAYFFRIRANLYYDQSYGFDRFSQRSSFGSVGSAIFADMNIGNQYPITIGVRYNHLLNQTFPRKSNWEFILPIHLF